MKPYLLLIFCCITPLTTARGGIRQLEATTVFEKNDGQAPAAFHYVAHAPGYDLRFASKRVELQFPGSDADPLAISFEGTSANSFPKAEKLQSSYSNYFLGSNPSRWRTRVKHYATVRYQELYEGIDLVFYSAEDGVEFDFEVSPEADPSRIRMRYTGARKLSIDAEGNLVILAGGGEIKQRIPAVYQTKDGSRQRVQGRYQIRSEAVEFALGSYDRSRPLVIDPVLSYVRYLEEGPRSLGIGDMTVDAQGNMYVCGGKYTGDSSNVIHVSKVSADGSSLVYSSSFSAATCQGISVDSQGAVYFVGEAAGDTPVTAGAYRSSGKTFAAKLNATGSALVYSTYLTDHPSSSVAAMTIRTDGSLYISGSTKDAQFPITVGAFNLPISHAEEEAIWILRLNPNGTSADYSTLIAGGSPAAMTLDAAGNIIVGGSASVYSSAPSRFPLTANALQSVHSPYAPGNFELPRPLRYDGFLLKLNPSGSAQLFGTFLGIRSLGREGRVNSVATNASGDIWATSAGTPPGSAPVNPATVIGFLARISASGSLSYVAPASEGSKVRVDNLGNAYLTMWQSAPYTPTAGAIQVNPAPELGSTTLFVKLNPAGETLYSTFLAIGTAQLLALDSSSNVYIAGFPSSSAPNYNLAGVPVWYQPQQSLPLVIAKIDMSTPFCGQVSVTGNAPTTVSYLGSSFNLSVNAEAGCAWIASTSGTATATASPGAGVGSRALTVNIDPNLGTQPIQGSIDVAGQTFSFNQQASPCQYSITPSAYYLGPPGARGSISIQTQPSCPWTAAASSRIQITSGAQGNGPGIIGFIATGSGAITVGSDLIKTTANVEVRTRGADTPSLIGSGSANLVWQSPDSGMAQVWSLTGSRTPAVSGVLTVSAAPGWAVAGLGDLDGNGTTDLLWQQKSIGAVQVWYMNGASLTAAQSLISADASRIVGVQAFSTDVFDSMVWQRPDTGAVNLRFVPNSSVTGLPVSMVLSTGNTWRIAAVADFNHDLAMDLIWQDPESGATQIWYGAKTDGADEVVRFTGSNPWRIAAATDVDGDGWVDLIWQDPANGATQIWFMGGPKGNDIVAVVPFTGPNAWRIVAPR